MLNPYFPTGDDLGASLIKRLRELKVPLLDQQRVQEFFKRHVLMLLSSDTTGKSLLADCPLKSQGEEGLIFDCPNRDTARKLRDIYLAVIKARALWQHLPKEVFFSWPGSERPMRVPYTFASNVVGGSSPSEEPRSSQSSDEIPIVTPELSADTINPQSRDEELICEINRSPLPASIVSFRNNKVLLINKHVLGFCNEPYDDVIGYDIRQLFEKRGEY